MFQTIRSQIDAPRQAAPPAPAGPAVPEPSRPPAPVVREVAVVLPEKVEVRLAERSGEVVVAVRAADPQLRQALQSDLSALAERLEQAGYRSEVSRPQAAAEPAPSPRIEAPAEARDAAAWSFEDGRRQRREQPQPEPRPQPRPKPDMRSLLHDLAR